MIDGVLIVVGHMTLSATLAWVWLKGLRHCTATVLNLFKD